MPYWIASRPGLVAVAQSLVSLSWLRQLGAAPTRLANDKIRITALVKVEHDRIVRVAGRNQKFHRRIVDIGHAPGPGPGLISERSQTAGEKIHSAAFGWVRDDLALNGHSTVRFRPSAPDRQLDLAHLVARVAQLAEIFELRIALAHVIEGLAPGA